MISMTLRLMFPLGGDVKIGIRAYGYRELVQTIESNANVREMVVVEMETRWEQRMHFQGQSKLRNKQKVRAMQMPMSCENDFKALMVEEFCPSNEMEKLESEFWNHKMATAPTRNEAVSSNPKCSKYFTHHPVNGFLRLCFNCQKLGHFIKDCQAPIRQAVLVNEVRMNNNPRVCYECGSPDHFHNNCPKMFQGSGQPSNQLALKGSRNNRSNGNQVRVRAFNMNVNAMEAVQDPKVVTGTFSLNDHFVTVLYDSGADFSFISTEFAPLLNVRPSIVNPSYVIKVSDGKKVEVDRIICDCKLELESSLFSINLIPLGHGSFDVIVGMDWLSQHKAVIVCHEKVVEIPVEDGRILRVHGERTVGITKVLKSVKKDEPIVRHIPLITYLKMFFPEDLSGLPPQRQVEFRIDLVPGATSITKSPYRLASSEMQELSGRFYCKFLQIANSLLLDDWGEKNQKYIWGVEQEEAFHTLKNILCDAPILTLPDGVEDFITGMREKIQVAHSEALKQENIFMENLHGLHQRMEKKEGARADKMYHDLRDMYWWPGMKRDIATYVSKCLTCSKTIDRLTSSSIFLAIREDYSTEKLAKIYVDEIVARHGVPMSIISDKDGRFTSRCCQTVQKALETRLDMNTTYHPQMNGQSERTIQTLEDMLRACVIDFGGSWDVHLPLDEFSYNNSYHSSITCAPFEALYGRKCRSPVLWAEIGESEIKVDKTLCFVEEPVKIMDREVKSLKRSKIELVKVRWNSKRGPEFTWERKDYMKSKYPQLFVVRANE
ncbi:putative reverse transcriptase domain-containing protein [Tanacetum coccineum]